MNPFKYNYGHEHGPCISRLALVLPMALLLICFLEPATAYAQTAALDFGDAPAPYPTFGNSDGARHALLRGFSLGSTIDAEFDGQPSPTALGDDSTPAGVPDDEDGVTFFDNPMNPGSIATVNVTLTGADGRLDAWIDFNRDGDWLDIGEQIFTSVGLVAGVNTLRFAVPSTAALGQTFARFRLSRQGGLKPTGFASDGEVEDYMVSIQSAEQPLDFGDAPSPYPTTLKQDGARHVPLKGFNLGEVIDAEKDGQPNSDASGDDINSDQNLPDDEDGVKFTTEPLLIGRVAGVEVILSSGEGMLDAWVDFNADGDWSDDAEQIFHGEPIKAGSNFLSFFVPDGSAASATFSRFRLSRQGGLTPFGLAGDGEVEDYMVKIEKPPQLFDFGDAPAPYPTTLAVNGARHPGGRQSPVLGQVMDVELDGQPNADATGDDLAGSANIGDDEDGVKFQTDPLIPGRNGQVEVTLSFGQARLDAWIDFNRDGDWADAGEQIIKSVPIVGGPNILGFAVPLNATPGSTFSRFRVSLEGGLSFDGPATDGEVEDYAIKIAQLSWDYGDAPTPYPTLLSQNGARHPVSGQFPVLGKIADIDADGQPNSTATGDDINPATAGSDEDGVKFLASSLIVGQTGQVEVTLSFGRGFLDAWIDFNGDGDWADPGEQIFISKTLVAGPNNLTFAIPSSVVPGTTFARFRLSQSGELSFTGPAADGEVEDYAIQINPPPLDFGDAPAPFPTTLKDNGARHSPRQGFVLGRVIDLEQDGQPTANADGDDLNPPTTGPDEDGVKWSTDPLIPGQTAQVEVTLLSGEGRLDAWIDYNRDGDWADSGEQIFISKLIVAGANNLSFLVPTAAVEGTSYARFRLSTQGGLSFTGNGGEGEVEDYAVRIAVRPLDFGDAAAPYPTTLKDNGARHAIRERFSLGSLIDREFDGQPNATAVGDDTTPAGVPSDEDGVRWVTNPLVPGQTATVEVTLLSGDGRLDAWVDFNRDGDWADPGEQIFTSKQLVVGPNNLTFPVPSTLVEGLTFARFRLSPQGGLSFTGPGGEGEVEDHMVRLGNPPLDFGDAPAPYPTTLKDNGARHSMRQGFVLGRIIDLEGDGQPNTTAVGDDTNPAGNSSDEDGIKWITTPLIPGQTGQVEVTLLSGEGRLDAWLDFNRDGDWADPGEQIFTSKLIAAGPNNLSFAVPDTAVEGASFARFRLSLQGGLQFTGPGGDGEVEDHLVRIGSKPEPAIDLVLNKTANPTVVLEDDILTYTITVVNSGPGTATGVTVTDPLAPSSTYVSAVSTQGSCSVDAAGKVTCNIGTLAPQASATITIQVRPNELGSLLNTATVIGNEPERTTDNNTKTVGVRVVQRPTAPCNDRTNKGTNFWVTFPGNYAPDPDNPVRLSIAIVGPRLTTGVVEIPALGFTTNYSIPVNHIIIPLPKAAELGDVIDIIENKGIHITASQEVAVYGMNRVQFTSDGFLALPTDVIGHAYIVQGFSNEQTGVPDLNGTEFAIVAPSDNTLIAIKPSVTTGAHPSGSWYMITLNKGQTYQLRNTNDAPNDLSGSLIVADKPIAVFGGHQCANVASQDLWFCDYLVEQLVSFERAGTRFMSMPLATRTNGSTFRFSAIANGTIVSVNNSPVLILNAGEIKERIIDGPAMITASHPILVTQYAHSSDFDGVKNSDPFMTILTHQGQYMNQYSIWTPDMGFAEHYINVVAPTAVVGALTLDGVAVPAASFTPISTSGFSGAKIKVLPGAHSLAATQAFGVICYGWGEYDSYGFPGGMFFGDTAPPVMTCPEPVMTVTLDPASNTPCTTVIPDLRRDVKVTDNCGLPPTIVINQEPKPGTVVGPGVHYIVLSTPDARGNIGYCVVEYRVIDPTPMTITCPRDMVVNCQSPEGAKVNFRVIAATRCRSDYPVESSPASGSFFPIGTTTVTSTATDASGKTVTCTFKVTVQCGGPTITITRGTNNQVSLAWSEGQVLQTAAEVTGPWSSVPNATSPFNVSTTSSTKAYYRIVPSTAP